MSSSLRDESTLSALTTGVPAEGAAAASAVVALGETSNGAAETLASPHGVRARVRRFVRREHAPVPLRRMLLKAVLNGAVIPICFVTSFAVTATLPPFMSIGPSHTPPRSGGPLTAEGVVMDLIEEHECWMGAAPVDMAGKVPGHAVVTWPGEDGPSYGGSKAVRFGLENRFEGKHPQLQVHGFCR